MSLHMTQRDYLLIIGAVLLSAVAGVLVRGISSIETIAMMTIVLTGGAAIAVLGALIAIYKGRKLYGGAIARNLEVIAVGLILFIVSYLPHVVWHVIGLSNDNALGPAWIGLSESWWTGFYHFGALMFFLISIYGFYLFWKFGNELEA
ncbi:MAG: hypothetical protein MUP66_03315 [Candidatus Nanohaloarchaeota archaeon QJJ-5]|nr:hypothetical protein [Candidatus Nanohaloarchaeota archaeon QJJ-5]